MNQIEMLTSEGITEEAEELYESLHVDKRTETLGRDQ